MKSFAGLLCAVVACTEAHDPRDTTLADTTDQADTSIADIDPDTAAPDAAAEADVDTTDPGPPCTADALRNVRLVVDEGQEVIPQTKLHLTVQDIPACRVTLRWSLEQPRGSTSRLVLASHALSATLEANVVGAYAVEVQLTSTAGDDLTTLRSEVLATAHAALHIELLWHTPGDPDPTDTGPGTGADLDLHVAHAAARGEHDRNGDGQPDPWFVLPYDAFADNRHPDWGSPDPAVDDNPSLDREDFDGDGPENLNLALLERDRTYHVGVHARDDHGFGPSHATVRIYLDAILVFEARDVRLLPGDLWWVSDLTATDPLEPPSLRRVCEGTPLRCTSTSDCPGACVPEITPGYAP